MPRSFWQKYSCCFASAKATTAIMGGSTFLIRDVALNVGPLVRSRTAFALHRGAPPPMMLLDQRSASNLRAASAEDAGFCPVTNLPSVTTNEAQSSPF